MSTVKDKGLSAEEALERARALTPVLRERSAATNKARRVPDQTIRDLHDAGLFRLLQPIRYGGVEQDMETFARTVIQLSRGCGSAGWVFSVLSIHQWMVGLYDDEAQKEVWGKDPRVLIASALRPSGKVTRDKGGYRLSGSWGFASGIDNSAWIIVGAIVGMTGTPPHPEVKMMLAPLSDGRIEDNWHVMGLRGTGSKVFACENAFIPEHRALDFAAAREGDAPGRKANPGPLYRLPAFANFPICIAAPGVGAAWGAYDRFIEYVRSRTNIGQKKISEFSTVQMRVAEASAMIDSVEQLLLRDCRESMDGAIAGRTLSMDQRARFRRNQCYAPKVASEAVEKLLRACGAAGLFEDFEIQQCYRDVYATAAHIGTNWDGGATQFGQVAMGVGHPEPLSWI